MNPYWWFQGASVEALTMQLNAAGPGARLEVHREGEKLTLYVKKPATDVEPMGGGGPIDDSHLCPPSCP